MKLFLYIYVAVAGALTSVEAGSNAQLVKTLGGVWWPAVVFSVLTLVLLSAAALVLAGPFPMAQVPQVPWWAWTGGVISALYILSMLYAPNKLGAGLFVGLTVSAAVVSSVAIDNWGLVGFTVHPAGVGRLIGAVLMLVGLACVAVF